MLNFLQSLILKMTVKAVFSIIISISIGFLFTVEASQIPAETDTTETGQIPAETDTTETGQIPAETDFIFDEEPSSEISEKNETVSSFWTSYVFEPMRSTLKYEVAYKPTKPDEIKNNRFSVRLEYSKFFLNNLFLQFDSRITAYWKSDHRSRITTYWINDQRAEADVAFETKNRETYLQASFLKTSIKIGIQILAWGESEFAAVTDEISPMDFREPFIISLEELRIGQPMLTVDQYLPFGDWSFFFIPKAAFNEHPKKGTGYYYDPFNGSVEYRSETHDENRFEYGMRWKKTFGKSDLSIMTARLIDNEYAYRMYGPGLITKNKWRYSLAGMTFNYAIKKFIIKGEVGLKAPRAYNNESFQIVKKNAVDASLGVDYYPSSTFIISMEAVNNHVIDWNDEIQTVPEDTYTMILILSKLFMHDNLSVNWITLYNGPHTTFFNILSTSYNWNDHLSLFFDTIIPVTDDKKSYFWIYRDQKQVVFKIQYQF